MDMQRIENFASMPRPPRENWGFLNDLKSHMRYHFPAPDDHAPETGSLKNGVEIFLNGTVVPQTALRSLRRLLHSARISELPGTYPIRFRNDPALDKEEYHVDASDSGTTVCAADQEGFRRAVYFLEDRIRETGSRNITKGCWQRKPFVKNRISRWQ